MLVSVNLADVTGTKSGGRLNGSSVSNIFWVMTLSFTSTQHDFNHGTGLCRIYFSLFLTYQHFYLLPDNSSFRRQPTESRVASLLRAEDWPSNCPRAIDVVQSWMPKKDHTGNPAILQRIEKQSWKGLCLKDFGPPKNKGEIISVMSNSNLSKGHCSPIIFFLLNCL